MILLITIDKNTFLKNYDALHNSIMTADKWWHHMNNTWLIKTDLTPTEWYNKLHHFITVKDRLMIIEVKANYQGWLKQEAWDWLKERFEEENTPFNPLNLWDNFNR